MDWAVECLSTFLRLHDWDECLGKEEVERMCSSLYTLAKYGTTLFNHCPLQIMTNEIRKEDSKSGKTRSWALYHLWIFVGLPSCQRAERAVFPPVSMIHSSLLTVSLMLCKIGTLEGDHPGYARLCTCSSAKLSEASV